MIPLNHNLLTRSASAILSKPRPKGQNDGTSDDMIIAQGLLKRPQIPRRETSLTGLANIRQEHEAGHIKDESLESSYDGRSRRAIRSSNTWTTSSGDIPSDHDEVEDRAIFVQEYNRLAEKHGVRIMVVDDYEEGDDSATTSSKPGSWFARNILRRTSSTTSVKADKHLKHRRSISDLSMRLKLRKDKLKDKSLQELFNMVRESLSLKAQSNSLSAPTSRGVFRIPGSHHIVDVLYSHYCTMDEEGEVISGTVRCPTLPEHIRCDVHDVASTFKKLLSGLPGGILGSLPLFDALVAIQGQLRGDPEVMRTKQSKVRGRLIALAIATLRSQYRRELICAVFGLLCMIGRAAETTKREDDQGRPLPTADLMGYAALGIVFGPLLVGDLLDNYSMHLANPLGGLVLLPISPPKPRREKRKKRQTSEEGVTFNTHVDKVKVANSIAEMLITHWRDVVRHMKSLGALKPVSGHTNLNIAGSGSPFLRPSMSETFALRKPPDWDNLKSPLRKQQRSESPTPARRIGVNTDRHPGAQFLFDQNDVLVVKKQRSRGRPISSQKLSGAKSMLVLSPTVEEQGGEEAGGTIVSLSGDNVDMKVARSASKKAEENPPVAPSNSELPRLIMDYQLETPKENAKHKKTSSVFVDHPKPLDTNSSHTHSLPESLSNPRNLCKHHIEQATPKFQKNSKDAIQSSGSHAKAFSGTSPQGKVDKSTKSRDKALYKSGSKVKSIKSQPSSKGRARKLLLENTPPYETPVKQPKSRKRHRSAKWLALQGPEAANSVVPSTNQNNDPQYPFYQDPQQANPLEIFPHPPFALLHSINSDLRRIAASEPIQRRELLVPEPRRVSKSMQVWPTTQRPFYPFTKDPLARVSREEDLASLAVLARVLKASEALAQPDPVTPSRPNKTQMDENSSKNVGKTTMEVSRLPAGDSPGSEKNFNAHTAPAPNRASPISNKPTMATSFPEPDNSLINPSPSNVIARSPFFQKMKNFTNNQLSPFKSTPIIQELGDLKNRGSSRGSVKALAAKFNNPVIEAEPKSTPKRSPQKPLSEETRARFESPRKESLVAPYTTNSPSPGKLQKPVKLEKTPQPKQKLLNPAIESKACEERDSKLVRKSTPRRVLVSSLSDTSSFRQRRKSFEESHTPSASFTANSVNPYAVSLKSIEATSAPVESPFVESFDGPSNSTKPGKVLPQMEPPPVPQNIQFSRPSSAAGGTEIDSSVHAESSMGDIFLGSATRRESSSPIPRSNSVLHAQIRNFQAQMEKKDEEIRRLKHQLNARSSLDIGSFSEQLREAKRELQIWKTRAELAEKQVELLPKIQPPKRSASGRFSGNPFKVSHGGANRLSADHSEDTSMTREKFRKSMHGMDGAGGSPGGSNDSSGTVIRETVVAGTEHVRSVSIWIAHFEPFEHLENIKYNRLNHLQHLKHINNIKHIIPSKSASQVQNHAHDSHGTGNDSAQKKTKTVINPGFDIFYDMDINNIPPLTEKERKKGLRDLRNAVREMKAGKFESVISKVKMDGCVGVDGNGFGDGDEDGKKKLEDLKAQRGIELEGLAEMEGLAELKDLPPPPEPFRERSFWDLEHPGWSLVFWHVTLAIPFALLMTWLNTLVFQLIGWEKFMRNPGGPFSRVRVNRWIFILVNLFLVMSRYVQLNAEEKEKKVEALKREVEWWGVVGEVLDAEKKHLVENEIEKDVGGEGKAWWERTKE
ncbi:hypothetical protein G7Y89_g12095 [Cudoniella acicularis]|uniref:Rho-GAP domain-containing protein n=1 Tax=Cudoniella acicularis TaxID=354080 RepID=A0A8H4VXP3_9HELO|nr:hypothetical protein G7Y89_g12095 [Cudoniella acicularis]